MQVRATNRDTKELTAEITARIKQEAQDEKAKQNDPNLIQQATASIARKFSFPKIKQPETQ